MLPESDERQTDAPLGRRGLLVPPQALGPCEREAASKEPAKSTPSSEEQSAAFCWRKQKHFNLPYSISEFIFSGFQVRKHSSILMATVYLG